MQVCRSSRCAGVLIGLLLLLSTRGLAQVAAGPFTVVVGQVVRPVEAEALWARVPNASEALLLRMGSGAGLRYRVCVGRLLDRPAAERLRQSMVKLYPEAWVLDLGTRVLAEPPRRDSLVARATPSSVEGFALAYAKLHEALSSLDSRRLQAFIHPTTGLWLRHNPGRLLVVQQCSSFDELLSLTAFESAQARRALEQALEAYRLDTSVLRAPATELPPRCTPGDSAASLRLVPTPLATPSLGVALHASKVQLLGEGLSAAEARATARADQSVRLALLHPNAGPVRGLYFAFEADRWYLTAIDLSCEP